VKVGELLRLVKCVVSIDGGDAHEAIKCVRIVDGTDSCTVAFVPRSVAKSVQIQSKLGGFAQLLELYDESESQYKKRKSHCNKGMAACVFLASIPQAE
jgi:hypothetical protein